MGLKTRFEAMDSADKQTTGGISNDMETSMAILGKRYRNVEGAMEIEPSVEGNAETHSRRAVLDIALSVDLDVVAEHAQ